jgi:flavorubredoxin
MKVLICYYSTYGNVYKMANLVAEGVSQVAGAEPHEAAICRALGRRLAEVGLRLQTK